MNPEPTNHTDTTTTTTTTTATCITTLLPNQQHHDNDDNNGDNGGNNGINNSGVTNDETSSPSSSSSSLRQKDNNTLDAPKCPSTTEERGGASGGGRAAECVAAEPNSTAGCERGGECCAGEGKYCLKHSGKSCETPRDNSHLIPGVEHVFFEDELLQVEKMETDKNIILLAVDDGCHSEIAFKFYKENVDRPGYLLHIVHHSDIWSHYSPSEDGPSADHYKEIADKAKGVVDETEGKYRQLMKDYDIQGEFITLHGKDAWHDIIQYQEKSKATMIVMGTRGSGALSRTFRGSVSDSVVHHANVPVLVCCHPKD